MFRRNLSLASSSWKYLYSLQFRSWISHELFPNVVRCCKIIHGRNREDRPKNIYVRRNLEVTYEFHCLMSTSVITMVIII